MPELPEVETIKRELAPFVKGKKIVKVDILRPKLIRGLSLKAFTKKILGDTILGVERRAKYLICPLKSHNSLIFHLGMTGALLRSKKNPPKSKIGQDAYKYARVVFCFSSGEKLIFSDLRLFGKIWLLPSNKVQELKEIKKLGLEPFSKEFTFSWFFEKLKRKTTKIKLLLMDQTFIAGIGNIYANEVLFAAGIDPRRPANKIDVLGAKKLYKAILDILRKAIERKGSSVDNYVDADGEEGSAQLLHKVYDKKGKPCFKCKGKVERISLGQRGTFFCPRCQK